MKRRNFFASLAALITIPVWLQGTPSKPKIIRTYDSRKGQMVVMYQNASLEEQVQQVNTYQYSDGWNRNAFEILKSERLDMKGNILLWIDPKDHDAVTKGMLAVFQDEEVGYVSQVDGSNSPIVGDNRLFLIVTVSPLNWKS